MVSKNFNIRPESICRFSLFYRHIFSRSLATPSLSFFSFLFFFFSFLQAMASRSGDAPSRETTRTFLSRPSSIFELSFPLPSFAYSPISPARLPSYFCFRFACDFDRERKDMGCVFTTMNWNKYLHAQPPMTIPSIAYRHS